MKISAIITAYREPHTIGKAIHNIIFPNKDIWADLQLIIVAPDDETLNAAKQALAKEQFSNYVILRDAANGKPAALNLAYEKCTGDILFMTDGDIYVNENAIKEISKALTNGKVAGVSGHPISIENKNNFFGYISHLFCEAAHQKRQNDKNAPMSGYIYAIRNLEGVFPIPEDIRAEDAYITRLLLSKGYTNEYSPNALAYVKFPKNLNDWIKQKSRSLGGNVQLSHFPADNPQNNRGDTKTRSISEDLRMILFPIMYAQTQKELLYSLILYPLRLYLWVKIYLNHSKNNYSKGAWERIESSK